MFRYFNYKRTSWNKSEPAKPRDVIRRLCNKDRDQGNLGFRYRSNGEVHWTFMYCGICLYLVYTDLGVKKFCCQWRWLFFFFLLVTICQYFVDTYIMSKTLATLIKDISIISDFIVGFYLSILAFSVQWSASRVTHLIIQPCLAEIQY